MSKMKTIIPAQPKFNVIRCFKDEGEYIFDCNPVIAWLIETETEDLTMTNVEPITVEGIGDPSTNMIAEAIMYPDGQVVCVGDRTWESHDEWKIDIISPRRARP